MKVLAIVTSPLQVQNATQYILQHDINFSQCVMAHVNSAKSEDNRRAISIAHRNDWAAIQQFPPFKSLLRKDFVEEEEWRMAEIQNRQEFMVLVEEFMNKFGSSTELVLLGDYRPMSFRQFLQYTEHTSPEVVLLDDGSVSRYVMEYRQSGAKAEEVTRGLLANLGDEDPFKIMESSSMTFFSIYDEDISQTDRIVKNTMLDEIDTSTFENREDEVWICGVNHVEAHLAKQDQFLSMCAMVSSWFPQKKLVYFPHRREDKEKVALVKKITNAEISEYAFGIEEYAINNKCKPHKIVVFGSTVADTLSRLYAPEERVIVAVPEDKYFTNSARSAHIKNIIVDNIRKNDHVHGLPVEASCVQEWLAAQAASFAGEKGDAGFSQRPDAPIFNRLKGLKASTGAPNNWLRLEETTESLMHRVFFGEFKRPARGSAYFHTFRMKAQERFAFKFRLAEAKRGKEFVDLHSVIDVPGSYYEENEFGKIAVDVKVDENRISTISVYFAGKKRGRSNLQLIAMRNSKTKSSLHEGDTEAGFSIAPLVSFPQTFNKQPEEVGNYVAQLSLPPFKSGFLAVRTEYGVQIVCLHSGLLKRFAINMLAAPMMSISKIVCLDCSTMKSDRHMNSPSIPDSCETKCKIRNVLNSTYPIFISVNNKLSTKFEAASKEVLSFKGESVLLSSKDILSGEEIFVSIQKTKSKKMEAVNELI